MFRAPRDYGNNNIKTYELTKFEYEVVETGEKVDLLKDFKANAVAGHYTIKNIPGNIIITTGGAERKEAIELVTLKGGVYEKQTGDGISRILSRFTEAVPNRDSTFLPKTSTTR